LALQSQWQPHEVLNLLRCCLLYSYKIWAVTGSFFSADDLLAQERQGQIHGQSAYRKRSTKPFPAYFQTIFRWKTAPNTTAL